MNNDLLNEKLEEVRMGLNVVSGEEYKATLTAITKVSAEILSKTLGPFAATTTIDDGTYTYPTKDGWSVLNRLRFGEAVQDTLFKFLKQISFTLNSHVGDGTTTAVIAANHFSEELDSFMEIYPDMRQADMLEMIEQCKDAIINELHSPDRLHKVNKDEKNGYEDIYKIAFVSSNRNKHIASIIKKIYDETDNPNIYVTLNANASETTYEIQRGYKLDAKLLFSECYINTEDKTAVVSDDSTVFIFDHNVTYAEHMVIVSQLISRANTTKKNLVIMAPYYDEVITTVLGNTIKQCANRGQVPNTMIVQVPLTLKAQKSYLDDFSVLVGAEEFNYSYVRMYNQMLKQYNAKVKGETLDDEYDEYKDLLANSNFETPDDIVVSCQGIAHKLTLSDKMVLLENFSIDTDRYKTRKDLIDTTFADAKKKFATDPLNNEYMSAHMRYVKFQGNTGVIHVGGDSELVRQCDKDSIDDAVLACRSAFENGYIRGLNLETISSALSLAEKHKHENLITDPNGIGEDAEYIMYHVFADTFKRTTYDVMANKYYGKDDIEFYKTTWSEDHLAPADVIDNCVKNNLCFDVVTEKFEEAGDSLVNSVSTDCEIVTAVSSIMSLLLSSNQLLSINRGYDRKRSKTKVLREEADRAKAYANGVLEAVTEHGVNIGGSENVFNSYEPVVTPFSLK